MAAVLPAASPSASELTEPVCLASAESAPVKVSVPPVPSLVCVSYVAIDTATTGVTPTLPPVAPPLASVTMPWSEVADKARSLAPLNTAPFASSAWVSLSAMLIATDAPTPVASPLPFTLALASALVVVVDCAVRLRLAPLACTLPVIVA